VEVVTHFWSGLHTGLQTGSAALTPTLTRNRSVIAAASSFFNRLLFIFRISCIKREIAACCSWSPSCVHFQKTAITGMSKIVKDCISGRARRIAPQLYVSLALSSLGTTPYATLTRTLWEHSADGVAKTRRSDWVLVRALSLLLRMMPPAGP
jgi:hypothetical protein